MSLLQINSISNDGRFKIIVEGNYMFIYYYKLMFPYKHGILDPVYFISYNRGFLDFLGASILAYLHLKLDDWTVIKEFHGDYQDEKLYNNIKQYTEHIIKGLVKVSDIVNSVAIGKEFIYP